jgi:hypothetical protein
LPGKYMKYFGASDMLDFSLSSFRGRANGSGPKWPAR